MDKIVEARQFILIDKNGNRRAWLALIMMEILLYNSLGMVG
jgi:hypothetical protein